MYETINERIKVAAIFEKGRVKPLLFSWKGKKQKIRSINLIHSADVGNSRCLFFSVSTEQGEYKIKYDTKSLCWSLEQIYLEG